MTGPCAVVLWMRDGSQREEVFGSRLQAERFLYLLPYLMTTMPEWDQVASAMLSPMITLEMSADG